jgi:hypothetical protein
MVEKAGMTSLTSVEAASLKAMSLTRSVSCLRSLIYILYSPAGAGIEPSINGGLPTHKPIGLISASHFRAGNRPSDIS